MSTLFEQINTTFRTAGVEYLTSYVENPALSPAFDPLWEERGDIERASRELEAWARTRSIPGITTSIQRIEGRTPAVLIDIPGTGPKAASTLIYGHLDKQPAPTPWSEGLEAFKAVRRDDRLYGRGVVDDGYSICVALLAIEALALEGRPYPRCVVMIEASEESGSPDLDAHLDLMMDWLGEVGLVLCLDSGGLDYDRLWVTSSLRGNLVITADVEVLRHGVHSGEASGVVPSSFRILRSLIGRLEDAESGEILLSELHAEIPPHRVEEAATLNALLGDPLAQHFPLSGAIELMGEDGTERILNQTWRPALSFTGIEGVPTISQGGNVLRSHTMGKLSIRLPPTVNANEAQAAVVAALTADPPYSATVTVEGETPAQGWDAPKLAGWLEVALTEGSGDGFGVDFEFCGEGGSIPFLATLGSRFPTSQIVATGALGPGSNAHGPDESLELAAAVGVTVAVAHMIEAAAHHD